MAMIPTYQDMLAQALQQSQQQQQAQQRAQQQGTQNRSIFDNPAFGNSLMKMGLTMLADSEQGYSLGESIGRGGLAFMQERQSQEELQRQAMLDQQERQRQEALLARQQLQDNLSLLNQRRQAMQYDAAAQQVQGLPQEYQGLGTIDPLSTVKLAATNAFNRQDAEREFAQRVQLQNMQYGNDRALAEYKARQGGGMGDMPAAVKEYMYYNQLPEEQRENFLNLKRQNPQDKRISGEYGDRFTAITSAPEVAKSRQQAVENIVNYYNNANAYETGVVGGMLPAYSPSAQLVDKEVATLNVQSNPFKGQGPVSEFERKMQQATVPNRTMRRETLAKTQLASEALTDIADFRRNFANEYVNKTGKWDAAGEKQLFDAANEYAKQRYLELFPEEQPKGAWTMPMPVKGGK
jgi:hypothetical protein